MSQNWIIEELPLLKIVSLDIDRNGSQIPISCGYKHRNPIYCRHGRRPHVVCLVRDCIRKDLKCTLSIQEMLPSQLTLIQPISIMILIVNIFGKLYANKKL